MRGERMQCIREETRITYSHDQQQFNVRELIKHWYIFSNQTDVNGDCFVCLGNGNSGEMELWWPVGNTSLFLSRLKWPKIISYPMFMRGLAYEKKTLEAFMTFLKWDILPPALFLYFSVVLKNRKSEIHFYTVRDIFVVNCLSKMFSWVLSAPSIPCTPLSIWKLNLTRFHFKQPVAKSTSIPNEQMSEVFPSDL